MPRHARAAAVRAPQAAPAERGRSDKYLSKVIGKALDIIAILRSSPQPLSLNELTLRLELAKSSVFRILHTLEVSGYLERDAAGRYTVAADLRASGPGQLRTALVDAAAPALKELSREFRETVSLAMRFDNRVEVDRNARESAPDSHGQHRRPHRPAVRQLAWEGGRRVSAGRSPRPARAQLRHPPLHRTHGHRRGRAQTRVRARAVARYSTDEEESVLEGCCFGTPILDASGDAIAAISVSSPKMRMRDERLQNACLRRSAARPAASHERWASPYVAQA